MNKTGKTALLILCVFIIFAVLLSIFRGSVISYILKKTVAEKSDGRVELVLESFHINIMNGYMSVGKPALLFSGFYMNEQKSIRIDKIVFEKIEIDKLNVWSLLFKRDLIASRFLIEKPEFWTTEAGVKNKSSFHPEKLIKALNQSIGFFSNINIRIADIEIQSGSVMLSEYATPDADPGLVDFTIILENFNTHPDSAINPNRILYSDEFRLKLRNLNKELQSGYILNIDSALFSSRHRDLIINGVSLQPGEKIAEQSNIGITAKKLAFNDIGLNEIRGLEDLGLQSVVLSNGTLINYVNEKDATIHKDTTDEVKGIDQLMKVLYDFRLDSISINNFDYYQVHNSNDTLISVNEIDFLMTNILIDSAMFQNLFWNLHFDDILLRTGSFTTNGLISGYNLDYNRLFYSNDERSLRMDGIHMTNDTTGMDQAKTNLSIPEFSIDGFSIQDLQKRVKQHLSISFINPEGNLDISSLSGNKNTGTHKFLFPGYLYLDRIELSNGNFHVTKDSTLQAGFDGLNLILNNLHLPETKNDPVRLKHINMQLDHMDAYLKNSSLNVSTGNISYKPGQFSFHQVHMVQNTPEGDNRLRIKAINIKGLDRERLMNDHELYFNNLAIIEPDLSGHFNLAGNDKNPQNDTTHVLTAPISLHIDDVAVKNGKLNTTLIYKNEPVHIKAGYNLISGPFYASKNDSLLTLLDNLDWLFELNSLEADVKGHHIQVKKVLTDSYNSEFRLSQLDISPSSGTKPDSGKISIRMLSLPSVDVKGLDYDLLLHNDSLAFRSIQIDQPSIDVLLPIKKDSSTKQKNGKLFYPKEYLVFGYDSIILNQLHVKIETQSEINNEFFYLKEFDFSHLKSADSNNNLIDDLVINFNEFSFYDSITHHFLTIRQGFLDNKEGTLYIQGIEGSKMARTKDGSIDQKKPGINFNSKGIKLDGIVIKNSLPSSISAHKLEIEDLDMNILYMSSKNRQDGEFRVKLELLNNFDNVLTHLQVDTAMLSDISLNIRNISDSAANAVKVDSIGIIIHKIHVDTSMVDDAKPAIINGVVIDLKGKTEISKDSLYEFQTGKIHYNFPDQRITVDSFYLTPLFESEEFFKRARYQTDRVKLFGQKLEFDGINLKELLSNGHVHISDISIDQLNADIYRDKHYPIKPGTYKPLPREQLMSIKRAFTIDSVHVTNAYLKYREMDAKSDEPGEVFLDQGNVTVYNITNQLMEGEKKDLILDLHARIMGQTLMSLKVHFPLNPDTLSFWLTGKTEKLDLTSLNPLTTNLLGIGIIKGKGSTDIQYIAGTDSTAKGSLVFRYKKLRVMPYSRKKEKLKKGVLSPLISFMINDLVVKSNNPKFARKPRVGQVYFERDTQKSVVNYVWKSVLSGLMSTMGFNTKAQKQERKEVKKIDKKN